MSDIISRIDRHAPNSNDGYLRGVAIDARNEITALRARLDAVEKERDSHAAMVNVAYMAGYYQAECGLSEHEEPAKAAGELKGRAERAEAALATARRDALGLCRDIAMQALTGDADGRDIYEQIDALANEAETSARGMPCPSR